MSITHSPKIHQLSEHVVEKIAAGEVVERPVSVLKELVENSLDAEATHITIHIAQAGFSRISVSDNGHGIPAKELALSLKRYSTSKIDSADDLFNVHTMGFRGEALASIAAVSRMTIQSSVSNDGSGNAVRVQGTNDSVEGPRPEAHTRGTTVEVRDLFFNVPARMKFMKSQRAEKMALSRFCEDIAIAHPEVHFTVIVDGATHIDVGITGSIRERIGFIAGENFAKRLIECKESSDRIGMRLYISPTDLARAKPRFQNIFVNTRMVENSTVRTAVRDAYSRFITGTYKPSFFCFLTIDPRRIDVNVHPSKLTVKFDDERAIFGFVQSTVRKHMAAAIGSPEQDRSAMAPPFVKKQGDDNTQPYMSQHSDDTNASFTSAQMPCRMPYEVREENERQHTLQFSAGAGDDHTQNTKSSPAGHVKDATAQDMTKPGVYSELISCYQIHNAYILTQIKNGIMLIDQHAAHERILFEQALSDIADGKAESQQLLFPVVVELSKEEKQIIDSAISYLASFGFSIREFGETTVTVDAIPIYLKDSRVQDAVLETIRFLSQEHHEEFVNEPIKRYAAAFACGAAIKSGQKLTQEEMNVLLNDLFAASNPYTCPHGRPTVIRLSLDEIAKRFLR